MSKLDQSRFLIPNDSPVVLLKCQSAFNNLTNKEKLYAHYQSRADWCGSLICLLQTSPESPGIYLLLLRIFRRQSVEELHTLATPSCLTDSEFQSFLIYSTAFLGNLGNYKSFGDTKFIPDVPQAKLEDFIKRTDAYKDDADGVQKLWDSIKDRLYSLSPREQTLGLREKGITTYFSFNCDISDAEIAQEFMTSKQLSAYNTRLFKYKENGDDVYEIRLASAKSNDEKHSLPVFGTYDFTTKDSKNVKVKVTRGDYGPLLQLVVENLAQAKLHSANDTEVKMLDKYIESFTEGSVDAHKDGSRFWIQNKGPIIELYIGFIESYRDPFGVRGEYEGFVAMVNKETTKRLSELVDKAEHFLPLLPWTSAYEKDKFQRPDFTSLDVLTFGSSGIPAGINIPNYDDIRQTEGFKNVSLGNVLSSVLKDSKITFLGEKDEELLRKFAATSFEVQVGLHELLGHGSGKLFQKDASGKYNFDIENVKNLETGQPIRSWYEPGEEYTSKFRTLSSSYEECRAECVGIFLCLSSEILRIFGHHGREADDIIYTNWLNMVRSGLMSLEFFSPDNQTWGQAHCQARFVILRVLLKAEENLVAVTRTVGSDGQPDILIQLDRSKINTVGKTAIGNFLKRLQLYKSTADFASGKEMFDRLSNVNDHEVPHFLSLRTIVLQRRQPRKIFVQCNTALNENNDVVLHEYEASPAGLIQSFVERFPDGKTDAYLEELWRKDMKHFPDVATV